MMWCGADSAACNAGRLAAGVLGEVRQNDWIGLAGQGASSMARDDLPTMVVTTEASFRLVSPALSAGG
jgi:hypothetical protein